MAHCQIHLCLDRPRHTKIIIAYIFMRRARLIMPRKLRLAFFCIDPFCKSRSPPCIIFGKCMKLRQIKRNCLCLCSYIAKIFIRLVSAVVHLFFTAIQIGTTKCTPCIPCADSAVNPAKNPAHYMPSQPFFAFACIKPVLIL